MNAPVVVSYADLNAAIQQSESTDLSATRGTAGPALDAESLAELGEALAALEQAETSPGILSTAHHQLASLIQSCIAQQAAKADKVEDGEAGGLRAKFDEKDWNGWVKSVFTWWKQIVPHRWVVAPARPDPLPNTARAAVLGDWGTGLYGAPVCARSIAGDPRGYDLLLHLGDVYYSGTDNEVAERFLDLWPSVPRAINRALNSNHEMYTGGHAYFQLTLRQFRQPASYFALRNDHWLLIGLDTAYEDHDLAEDQVEWLRELAGAGGQKIILFSHHQPYSLIDNQGPKLVKKLAPLLDSQRIFAWYWGHEHRCVVYDRHPAWGLYGRCIGHSGYPYFRKDLESYQPVADRPGWRRIPAKNTVPGAVVLDGPNPYVPGHESDYGPNGYLTLELDGDRLTELVHAASGEIVYRLQLCGS